jgi:hypothetical protein
MKLIRSVIVTLLSLSTCRGQQEDYPDYQDYADSYQQDNLYADYAARQEIKDRYVFPSPCESKQPCVLRIVG